MRQPGIWKLALRMAKQKERETLVTLLNCYTSPIPSRVLCARTMPAHLFKTLLFQLCHWQPRVICNGWKKTPIVLDYIFIPLTPFWNFSFQFYCLAISSIIMKHSAHAFLSLGAFSLCVFLSYLLPLVTHFLMEKKHLILCVHSKYVHHMWSA